MGNVFIYIVETNVCAFYQRAISGVLCKDKAGKSVLREKRAEGDVRQKNALALALGGRFTDRK